MSDPFRSLDQIDPPDQWDDIVDRASHDTEVRLLDDSPRRTALSRPRTWVAAAAVLALVGGGIALAAGDDPDGVRIDPAESTTAPQDATTTIEGECSFTVTDAPLVPAMTPGRNRVEPELGILPGPTEPTFAHGEVDGLLVEVAVGTGMTTAADPADVEPGGVRTMRQGDGGFVEVAGLQDSGVAAPCDQVAVVVRKAVTAQELDQIDQIPSKPISSDVPETLAATLAAISVRDAATEAEPPEGGGETPETPAVPMGGPIEGTLGDGTSFRVWDDPPHGLCVRLGDRDLGCDDVGPAIGPDDDPSTARLAVDECCPPLWYGYLPEGAVGVALQSRDGLRLLTDAEPGLIEGRVWAYPVPTDRPAEGLEPPDTTVIYAMDDGTRRPAPTAG